MGLRLKRLLRVGGAAAVGASVHPDGEGKPHGLAGLRQPIEHGGGVGSGLHPQTFFQQDIARGAALAGQGMGATG